MNENEIDSMDFDGVDEYYGTAPLEFYGSDFSEVEVEMTFESEVSVGEEVKRTMHHDDEQTFFTSQGSLFVIGE